MILLVLVPPVLVGLGYLVHRSAWRPPRALLWIVLVACVAGAERLSAHEGPFVRLAAMTAWAFLVLKVMVGEEERRDGMASLSLGRWLSFSLLWIGMRPRLFAAGARRAVSGALALAVHGAIRVAIGLLLVGAARLVPQPDLAAALVGAGLLLVFHFGLCTIVAAAWRSKGIRCDPIVREPTRSRSLTDFWSRRWNLAYSEMCAIVFYRPLTGRLGRGAAVLLVFLFSGVLHEMAISLPVNAGYGLPMLYFALHGGLVLVEEALARRGRPIRGIVGRIWAYFWIFAPLPILFHRPFVAGVLLPLCGHA
jgi:alginate O-acetyltransferase complex protein AlgI